MVNAGDCLKVTTKTLHDAFGTCFYEVVEVGLKSPEKGREEAMDGVKCVMLGGSGPSARPGFTVIDSQMRIGQNIADGKTQVLPKEQAQRLVKNLVKKGPAKGSPGEAQGHTGTGVMEI